jgi:hypothetical protein
MATHRRELVQDDTCGKERKKPQNKKWQEWRQHRGELAQKTIPVENSQNYHKSQNYLPQIRKISTSHQFSKTKRGGTGKQKWTGTRRLPQIHKSHHQVSFDTVLGLF